MTGDVQLIRERKISRDIYCRKREKGIRYSQQEEEIGETRIYQIEGMTEGERNIGKTRNY